MSTVFSWTLGQLEQMSEVTKTGACKQEVLLNIMIVCAGAHLILWTIVYALKIIIYRIYTAPFIMW